MEYKNIRFDLKKSIGLVTFNRPKALNAINRELLKEFSDILKLIEKDENIKVLIITGEGEKSFISGADINELSTFDSLQGKNFAKMGQDVINYMQELPIPIIAAVNGFALGGGCEVALASDFVYASSNSLFGLPEIKLGIIPGFGGTQRLPRLIGISMAKEMIFTGKIINANKAKEIGLVNEIYPHQTLMETVINVANGISEKGKVSLRAAKQSINNGLNTSLDIGCKIEIDSFALCMSSKDGKEGTKAFLEKRKPNFLGKLNY